MTGSARRYFVGVLVLFPLLFGLPGIISKAGGAGEGDLLKRSPEETCHACHKTDKNAPGDSNAIRSHNSANIGSTKWSSSGGWGVPGGKYGEFLCTTCHTAHDTGNIYLLRETILTPNGSNWGSSGSPSVNPQFRKKKKSRNPDPGSSGGAMGDDSDSHTSSSRICEVCHSITSHHRYNTSGQADGRSHFNDWDCTACHSHKRGFKGGGSGKAHTTHLTEGYGPKMTCDSGGLGCHGDQAPPVFGDGQDLANTTVCDPCHSKNGYYNGLNSVNGSVGAKDNWPDGVYNAGALKPGKEKWCAGCHDDVPSVISGISAPNVIGNETGAYTYGTGWGFYKTGHGLPSSQTYPASGGVSAGAGKGCLDCHDATTSHIDGNARTFDDGNSSSTDPSVYRTGYRLKLVPAGQGTGSSTQEPMLVPWPTSKSNSANNYRLCVTCHDSGPFTDAGNMNTNFKTKLGDTDPLLNRHEYHLGSNNTALRYSPDWSRTKEECGTGWTCDSKMTCVACHNVHGSTRLAMVRDGKLADREPGLKIWYYNPDIVDYASPPDTEPSPADVPLTASTGTIWSSGSSANLCSNCHGNNNLTTETRTPYQDVQQPPTLAWTGENGYESDGVNPDSAKAGSSFTFRVEYADENNDAPVTMQLWLDKNNNGVYEDNANPALDEKIDMAAAAPGDHDYTDGKIYTATLSLSKRTGENNSTYNYRFYSENSQVATGPPASEKTLTVMNNAPKLSWTGEAYYQNSGVYPATGGNNSTYTFRIRYKDADNECPPLGSDIQVWIDENNNGIYDSGEKHNMTAADGNACLSGRVYTYSMTLAHVGDGHLSYTFRASDGFAQAAADAGPVRDNVVTVLPAVNTPPRLDWAIGGCRTEGVSPHTGAAGADFTFLVNYTDQNNSCPASGSGNIQVWIDENNNGIYEDSEKYNLTEVESGDTDCTDGKLYKTTRALAYAGNGNLAYRFYATDGSLTAIGDPADSDSTVTVVSGARKVRPTGGSGWYSTIQSAVSAGQTILVYPNADFTAATYNESIFVNGTDNVTIRSVCGPDYTIIDGAGSGYAVRGNASNNLTVDGFSLTGDTNGVNVTGGSTVALSNSRIYGNAGVGIASYSSALTITNCDIYSNASTSVLYGGGIYLNGGTHMIMDSTISNNTSQSGAGIYAISPASVTITGTTIRDNSATGIGGGMYLNAGTLNMSRSTVSGNTSSSSGGGFYLNSSPTVNLENCVLTGNSGTAGGMAYINSGTTTITNCTVADNQATTGNGGAIYSNNVPVVVRNSIFWNNTASGTGHNLYKLGDASANPSTITDSDVITGRPYISNCTVTLENNIAEDPLFIGGGDYHLQSISPVIDEANVAYAPADDRDANARPQPQGGGYDMGAYEFISGAPETEAPVVTAFTATTPSSSRNIPITAFAATDNTGVTGYRITTSPTPPLADDSGWTTSAPVTYFVTSDGTFALYPWAKDASGNVSAAFGSPATVVVDATAPNVTAFAATSPSTSLTIPITSFTATDTVGVTGYQITTNSTPPSAGGGRWSGTPPSTYSVGSDGTYTLYPWAEDAIGNVSAVFATPRTVVVDTTPPTVSSTNPSNGASGVTANSPVTINWNENVDCATVTASTVTISPQPGTWTRTSCGGSQAVFSPTSQGNLTPYTVTVSTSVKDSAGNAMASPYQFSYTTAAVSNHAPVLNWASATNCLTEGVRPRTGAINADFEFRVVYSDADGQCPTSIQVTVSGTPYDLTSSDSASCQTGRTYYRSITVSTAGDLNYAFSASDSIDNATGTPTTNHVVSVTNTTYKVRPAGGSGWYNDLATAYNATPASGTLLVYPNADFTAATYTGGLNNINKTNRTLQSVCGADLTIISGGGTQVIYLLGNDGAVIDGFSITGGTTYGIYSNGDSLTVKNCKIYSNSTGIRLDNACNPVSIQKSEIYNNASYGIISSNISSLVGIADSNIHNNGGGATNGAGINFNGGAGTHTINNTLLTGNTTTGNGGAIYCVNCVITIDDSTINNNKAGSGGAIYFLNPSVNATITDTFIQGNEATGALGGAIYMGNGAENLTNVMLTGNKAATNGGAIYINGGTTNLLYSTLSSNYAAGYGGALYQNSSTQTTVQNSIIYNNDALNGGNYKQIFATSPRYTYVDVYYTLISQLPGANISGPPDQRCSYEDMGGNNTTGNPNFVSPLSPSSAPTAGGDYRLQSGSPAVNAASSSWTSDHDIFDHTPGSRPKGSGYDMGAHEKE